MIVWSPPGCGKSQIAQQVANEDGYRYVDIRALLLDPVDLRGIPWRDEHGRTRWAPPSFLPPTDSTELWLLNLEELASCVPMVQAALYQLTLERKCGSTRSPRAPRLSPAATARMTGAWSTACRRRSPTASSISSFGRIPRTGWPGARRAESPPEVLFFVQMRPELLYQFDPESASKSFPTPRSWEIASNIVHRRASLDANLERSLFQGTVGEAAAVEFAAFLKVWRELPHPKAVIDDPENAAVPENASALIALCGSLYRMANDVNLGSIVSYAMRLRRELGEFLVGSCIRREPQLQHTDAFIRWAAARTQ